MAADILETSAESPARVSCVPEGGRPLLPTKDQVLECLEYTPETGEFRWAKPPSRKFRAGSVAGGLGHGRYLRIRLAGTDYYSHRLAWLVVHGRWPEGEIDHINGVRTDNRISNLRDVNVSQNQQASFAAGSNSIAGLRGVSFNTRVGRFYARIWSKGECLSLGYFATAKEAYAAYLEAKARLHPASTASKPYFVTE